ncbi:decarboxylating cobalt-precorrin-6B (C(15))-methyltransferase [Loigolactobacillus jiayinensis]|uniref:Decarboxylating cobalt-precorrin-6B (C(15))-methyltransferase n=1 Tax=Loigolactobacillus jiayinensis TaxID=2486016 RepID=A0ABW1RAK9_9LACO|nr:decarboxylating cobalt-precorrin-6B (C(15))-methyltransferase [Loigolactobacillus jiayinensis]
MRDDEFLRSKVPMTKAEVRAISITALQLSDKKTLLDIGAGTGSISVQAAHDFPQLQVTAIEQKAAAIEIMQQNIEKFQLANITLLDGAAPAAIPEQTYDAIFVGGSGQQLDGIVDFAADHLIAGGQFVLNFILFENALAAYQLVEQAGFKQIEMVRAEISKWHKLGPGHYFQPQNPTMILTASK